MLKDVITIDQASHNLVVKHSKHSMFSGLLYLYNNMYMYIHEICCPVHTVALG